MPRFECSQRVLVRGFIRLKRQSAIPFAFLDWRELIEVTVVVPLPSMMVELEQNWTKNAASAYILW